MDLVDGRDNWARIGCGSLGEDSVTTAVLERGLVDVNTCTIFLVPVMRFVVTNTDPHCSLSVVPFSDATP